MGLFAKLFGGMPLKQIKALAEQGNVAAQSEIGTMYAVGEEVVRDYVQAAYWYRQAADQGDADARDKLERIIAGDIVKSGVRLVCNMTSQAASFC